MIIKDWRISPFLWEHAVVPILICGLSVFFLANTSWYTDDQESLVRGYFLSDLYVSQWSVHFPLLALISGAVDSLIGQSWFVNRMMAMMANCAGIWFIQRAFLRISANSDRLIDKSLWKQFLYFSPLIVFLTNTYAHTNVTALWAMLFVAALISSLDWSALKRNEHQLRSRDCIIWGLLSVCVVATRVISGLQLVLFLLAFLFFTSWNWKNIFWFFLSSLVGLAGIYSWLLWTHTVDDFLYWTLVHNLKVKKSMSLLGYIGNLDSSHVPWFWVFALMGMGPFIINRQVEKIIRATGWILLCGFVGGILAANPSGISTSLQHALPAFPFLVLLLALALTNLSLDPYLKRIYAVILFIGVLVLFPRIVGDMFDNSTIALREQTQKDGALLRDLVPQDKRIMLLGVNPIIYYFADRRSGSFASILLPDLSLYRSKLIEDAKDPQVFCFYVEDYGYWREQNSNAFPEFYGYVVNETKKMNERIYCK